MSKQGSRILLKPKQQFLNGSMLILAGFIAVSVYVGFRVLHYSKASSGYSATTLDSSGTTIPDTNYAIPAGAIYMATNGNDANAGTTTSTPVLTINKAIALVPSGGTIVMRGGMYRDWYNSSGSQGVATKSVTIQAYPHEQPWFDGTDVKAAGLWTSDGAGHWSMPWNTPTFCGGNYYLRHYENQDTSASNSGPCTHWDMYFSSTSSSVKTPKGDPQMVFANGANMPEVDTLAAATGGAFYYDWTNKMLYISTNPSTSTVEVATRPSALFLNGANSKVLGIGFTRYATNEYNNNTEAALIMGAAGQLLENSVFTLNAGAGLGISNPSASTVDHSVFANNGFDGLESNGHAHCGQATCTADNLIIQNSVINHNNAEGYGYFCSASCSQAGMKMAHMDGFTFQGNIVTNNVNAQGYWCDLACTNGVMVNNLVTGNGKSGIMYEVSDTGIIASNLLINNAGGGIRVAAANTKIYNNTTVSSGGDRDIWIYDDPRTPVMGDVGPNTSNVSMVNNVYSTTLPITVFGEGSSSTQTSPDTAGFFGTVADNAYYRVNTSGQTLWAWKTATGSSYYSSISSFTTAHGLEAGSADIVGGSDPFFVSPSTADYRIRSGSVAKGTGTPLPADVATAIGVSAGVAVDKGALNWPGMPGSATPTPTPTPTSSSLPTVPQNLAATPESTKVTVTWTAPASTGGSPITGYRVTRETGDSVQPNPWTSTVSATTLSQLFTALVNGTSYSFSINAITANGEGPKAYISATPAALVGDINGDGKVNAIDLSTLLTRWGTNDVAADINHDGIVNAADLSSLLTRWMG